jgi:hypothetical protein
MIFTQTSSAPAKAPGLHNSWRCTQNPIWIQVEFDTLSLCSHDPLGHICVFIGLFHIMLVVEAIIY